MTRCDLHVNRCNNFQCCPYSGYPNVTCAQMATAYMRYKCSQVKYYILSCPLVATASIWVSDPFLDYCYAPLCTGHRVCRSTDAEHCLHLGFKVQVTQRLSPKFKFECRWHSSATLVPFAEPHQRDCEPLMRSDEREHIHICAKRCHTCWEPVQGSLGCGSVSAGKGCL